MPELAVSPLDPPLAATVYALAATAQVLLAGMILARQPRREWAWIFAGLFMANAGYAFGAALRIGFPGQFDWAIVAGLYFDQASFILLAYLALAFPQRVRPLQRLPWLLPALAVMLVAGVFLLNSLHLDGFREPRSAGSDLNPMRLFFGFLLPATVWVLLLFRWTLAWLRPMPAVLRQQFQLVFAVFAIRAGSQLVFTLPVPARPETLPGLLAVAEATNVVALVAFLVAMGLMALKQNRQAGTPRSQTFFVLAFMAAGLTIGALSVAVQPLAGYYANTWAHFDLYVLRPAMIWIAISRYSLLGMQETDDRWGMALIWLLSLATFTQVASPFAGQLPGLAPLAWTLLLGTVFATVLVVAARHWLLARVGPGRLGMGLESYRTALAEAHRNGEPSPRERRELERLREWLGVTPEQHAAMLQEVQAPQRGESPQALTPGEIVCGRYRIQGLIGEGATGETLKAYDVLLGEPVALKRTRRLGALHRRSILREAETLAQIQNPNVVRLLRVAFIANEPVLVLEWMPGSSLQGRLAKGKPFAIVEAVRIALDVLNALKALHAAGIVHGDVKPGNVLFGGDGTARLADFGAAHAVRPLLGDPTTPGVPAGSLRYMAPELLAGGQFDGRADLYAVAVLLHEMLAGRHPLPQTFSDYQLRKAIVEGQMPELPSGVPRRLREAIARGLEKQPSRRWASASAFAKAIAIAGTPSQSAPNSARRRSKGHASAPSEGAAN